MLGGRWAEDTQLKVVVIKRTWVSAVVHKLSIQCLVKILRNDKIYADISPGDIDHSRDRTVLETWTGPNLTWSDELPSKAHHLIPAGQLPNMFIANRQLPRMKSHTSLKLRLRNMDLEAEFILSLFLSQQQQCWAQIFWTYISRRFSQCPSWLKWTMAQQYFCASPARTGGILETTLKLNDVLI